MAPEIDSPVAFSPDLPGDLRALGWARVELLEQVGSTNAHAVQAASPWHLVAAHDQTAGRGRLARTWQVPPGASVALSVTMPLPQESPAWGWVPLFAGSVVVDAVTALCPGAEVALKWPNDVLVREVTGPRTGQWAKVAGILCQVIAGAEPLVVVGIGLNVAQTRAELPVPNATSLRLLGAEVSRDDALRELARRLRVLGAGWDDAGAREMLRERVRSRCSTIGSDIVVHTSDGSATPTRAVGIHDDGRLVTQFPGRLSDDGPRVMQDTVTYSVADIEHIRPGQKESRG